MQPKPSSSTPQVVASEARPVRAHPAHGVLVIEGRPTIVFLTVCTKDRAPWLAARDVHDALLEVWREATAWLVGQYVLMPDHLHLFAGMVSETIPLDNWVKYWKSQFRKHHKRPDRRFQPDHWDTRVRDGARYEEQWNYVRDNPVRQGLVERAEDWPFQGEVFSLPWE
jgi:putative transposase